MFSRFALVCTSVGINNDLSPLDSNDLQAVRKLEESLPEDLIETCHAREKKFLEEDLMDQDGEEPHMANDAGIEQNIIELRFHMALRETLESLDEAEEQWGAGPMASLSK